MKYLLLVALCGAMAAPLAQEPPADKDTLRQAFDGAMTCSALAAIEADKAAADSRWQWENGSYAFGKLAAQFWQQATDTPPTGEKMNEALNRYAGSLLGMEAEKVAEYDTACRERHADIDKLCEANTCIHAGPPATAP